MHVHHHDTILFSFPGGLNRTNLGTGRARAVVAECQNGLLFECFRGMFVALIREGARKILCPYPPEPSFRIVRIVRQVVLTPAGTNARIPHCTAQTLLDINDQTKLFGGGDTPNPLRCCVLGCNGAE